MSLADKLRQLLGNDAVVDDAETLAAHSGDKWFAAETPEVVVFARSTSDVSKLVKFASQNKIPMTARGAGYGYVGGCVPVRKGIALSLMRMNRIKEIHFVDAIAIVEPGVITADLKAAAQLSHPETGRSRRRTAKRSMSMIPVQNTGMEVPRKTMKVAP